MIGPAQQLGPMVLVEDLDAPVLADADRHHLERVLRLRSGAPLVVCDGAGSWRAATWGATLGDLGAVVTVARPAAALVVGFALVKGERPELVTQKLTEIGVDVIVPFAAERSVVRWDREKAAHHRLRLERVAREACQQSRRPHLPEVLVASSFDEVVTGAVASASPWRTSDVALADMGAPPFGVPGAATPRVVLVGPEGGWSDVERERVERRVGLGPHVLRAETAAIVAGAYLLAGHPGRWTHAHGG